METEGIEWALEFGIGEQMWKEMKEIKRKKWKNEKEKWNEKKEINKAKIGRVF